MADRDSGKKFLVDTGSSYSIIPHRSTSPPFRPVLKSASGQLIKCWGVHQTTVNVGGHRHRWPFIRAEVSFPILGVDFMRHFELVDVAANQLVHRSALAPVQAPSAVTAAAASCTVTGTAPPQVAEWRAVLDAFPEITKPVSGAIPPLTGSSTK
jgi:hypothetical protein